MVSRGGAVGGDEVGNCDSSGGNAKGRKGERVAQVLVTTDI